MEHCRIWKNLSRKAYFPSVYILFSLCYPGAMQCPKCEKRLNKQTLQCPCCGILIPRGYSAKLGRTMIMDPKLCTAVGLLLAFIGVLLLISEADYLAMLPIVLGGVLLFVGKSMKP